MKALFSLVGLPGLAWLIWQVAIGEPFTLLDRACLVLVLISTFLNWLATALEVLPFRPFVQTLTRRRR